MVKICIKNNRIIFVFGIVYACLWITFQIENLSKRLYRLRRPESGKSSDQSHARPRVPRTRALRRHWSKSPRDFAASVDVQSIKTSGLFRSSVFTIKLEYCTLLREIFYLLIGIFPFFVLASMVSV